MAIYGHQAQYGSLLYIDDIESHMSYLSYNYITLDSIYKHLKQLHCEQLRRPCIYLFIHDFAYVSVQNLRNACTSFDTSICIFVRNEYIIVFIR